jgi:aspartate kinase
MIVIKFGGTSVGEIARLEQAIEIVAARHDRRPVVVVSALSGVTNQLVDASRAAADGDFETASKLVVKVRERHEEIAYALIGRKADFYDAFHRQLGKKILSIADVLKGLSLVGEVSERAHDLIVSLGEQLSSVLFTYTMRTRALTSVHIDSGEVIETDDRFGRAEPRMDRTRENAARLLLPELERGHIPVMGGFFGRTAGGASTTLGRGGSDYSAAIVGNACQAEEIQIWTDVDGIMTCDPRIIPGARVLDHVTYDEAAELAYFGAKVLHPKTIWPAVERSIPVRVLNTHNPSSPGTLITAGGRPDATGPRGLAIQKGISILRMTSTRMLGASGYLARLFEVFSRLSIAVDVIASSEVSVTVTIEENDRINRLVAELSPLAEIEIVRNRAIIAIVGRGLTRQTGTLARIFAALEPDSVSLLSSGSADINLTLGVDAAVADDALRRIHKALFEGEC